MAYKISIPELKIQPQNEMDSWQKFINYFKIATIAKSVAIVAILK